MIETNLATSKVLPNSCQVTEEMICQRQTDRQEERKHAQHPFSTLKKLCYLWLHLFGENWLFSPEAILRRFIWSYRVIIFPSGCIYSNPSTFRCFLSAIGITRLEETCCHSNKEYCGAQQTGTCISKVNLHLLQTLLLFFYSGREWCMKCQFENECPIDYFTYGLWVYLMVFKLCLWAITILCLWYSDSWIKGKDQLKQDRNNEALHSYFLLGGHTLKLNFFPFLFFFDHSNVCMSNGEPSGKTTSANHSCTLTE